MVINIRYNAMSTNAENPHSIDAKIYFSMQNIIPETQLMNCL